MNLDKSDFPSCFAYYLGVANGGVLACKYVKKMALREVRDYKTRQHSSRFKYRFDVEAAQRALAFYRSFPFVAGERAERGEMFEPEPWQEAFLASLEGWRSKEDKSVRRYTRALLMVPRKSGKTTLAALLALRELLLGTAGGEIYSLATNLEQAKLSYRIAEQMLQKMGSKHPLLLKTRVMADGIAAARADGVERWWRPLSSKASGVEGRSASFLIVDEAALIENRRLVSSMVESGRARRSPLTLFLTTAQPFRDTFFVEQLNLLEAALDGREDKPRLFGLAYTVDRKSPQETDDELFARISEDKKLWRMSNPNLGVSNYEEHMEDEVHDAKVNPGIRPALLMKSFNVWAASERQWIAGSAWDACARDDVAYEGACYMGVDIGMTGDLTAVAILHLHGTGNYSVQVHCFMPQTAYDSVTQVARQIYDKALESGHLEIMGDRVLDKRKLLDRVLELREKWSPVSIGADPWQAGELVEELENEGQVVMTVRQGTSLSMGVFKTEDLIADGRIRHDGKNSFLSWQVGNCRREDKPGGRVLISKDSHERKIDGAMAMINAVFVSANGEDVVANFTDVSEGDVRIADAGDKKGDKDDEPPVVPLDDTDLYAKEFLRIDGR